MPFFKFYEKDPDKAEALLLEITKMLKKPAPTDTREFVPIINHVIHQMVFSPEIAAIGVRIVEGMDTPYEDVEKFTKKTAAFSDFLKLVVEKLALKPQLQSIREFMPRDFDMSFGALIELLISKGHIGALQYGGPFARAQALVDEILSQILLLQRGSKILIDEYPRLRKLIHPMRAILTDPVTKQRMWTTVVRVVKICASES